MISFLHLNRCSHLYQFSIHQILLSLKKSFQNVNSPAVAQEVIGNSCFWSPAPGAEPQSSPSGPPTLPPPPVTCRRCWEPESVSWPTPKPWLLLATFHLHFWPVELIALFLNMAVKFEFSILTLSIMAVGLCLEQRWWYECIDPFCLGISGHVY